MRTRGPAPVSPREITARARTMGMGPGNVSLNASTCFCVPPLGWTLFPSAAPETPFQSHLPNRCVTARPPYALHTLLVNLGPQSASLVSCFLLLDRQARPVPVCATSRPRISWQLPLWGQDPTGTGSARAKCKNRRSCSPYFHSGRSTGARLPLGTVMSGARPLGVACSLEQSRARFKSCGFYPTSVRKPTRCSGSAGMPCA
jgi:hypothetical protein